VSPAALVAAAVEQNTLNRIPRSWIRRPSPDWSRQRVLWLSYADVARQTVGVRDDRLWLGQWWSALNRLSDAGAITIQVQANSSTLYQQTDASARGRALSELADWSVSSADLDWDRLEAIDEIGWAPSAFEQ